MPDILIEVCVDSVESALAAQAAGAGRVELCDNLVQGGTTPSAGMMALCAERLEIPVHVMIRPRGGDFLYSELEVEVMRYDVELARRLGAAGVVFGSLLPDGTVDGELTRALVDAARPLTVTFHRAFDVCRDPFEALSVLIEYGVDRVLTSGQRATAEEGLPVIRELVREAGGRIGIIAGGGIRERNVRRIIEEGSVAELHLRGAKFESSPMGFRNPQVEFGGKPAPLDIVREITDAGVIERVVGLAAFVAHPLPPDGPLTAGLPARNER